MATILSFEGLTPRIDPTAWIAPTAVVIGNVVVEAHASVWYGAVIRGDEPAHEIRVGARTSVQDNCVIHVSARGPKLIGPEVTVGHGAVLESCTIGRGALIGMNAVVLQRAVVGEDAIVAAGAVVMEGADIPARHLAAGAPARVKKEMDPEAIALMSHNVEHYVELAPRHRASLAQQQQPLPREDR